nr:MAG TPA: zinc-ribbon containing domain protein [Caudoviricetes sp.]
MKKCPVCGHIMEDEALFCSMCGDRLSATEEKAEATVQKGKLPVVSKAPLKLLLIIVAAIIALVFFITLVILPRSEKAAIRSKITDIFSAAFPGIPIKKVIINNVRDFSSVWEKQADVTIVMDCALTESEYDEIYRFLYLRTLPSADSSRSEKPTQVSPLEIIDNSGNDYASGYWSRREPDPTVMPQSGSTPAPTLSSQSNPGVSEEDAKWAVYLMAEETIPKYLNCPSTMEMGLFRDCTIKDVGFDIWKGEGYFDAENLYGATVRSKWNITCTIKNGIIHVAKLKIDDIVVYNDGTQ